MRLVKENGLDDDTEDLSLEEQRMRRLSGGGRNPSRPAWVGVFSFLMPITACHGRLRERNAKNKYLNLGMMCLCDLGMTSYLRFRMRSHCFLKMLGSVLYSPA